MANKKKKKASKKKNVKNNQQVRNTANKGKKTSQKKKQTSLNAGKANKVQATKGNKNLNNENKSKDVAKKNSPSKVTPKTSKKSQNNPKSLEAKVESSKAKAKNKVSSPKKDIVKKENKLLEEKKTSKNKSEILEANESKNNKAEKAPELKADEKENKESKTISKKEAKRFLEYIWILLGVVTGLLVVFGTLYVIKVFDYPEFKTVILDTGTAVDKLSLDLFIKKKGNLTDKAKITYKKLETIKVFVDQDDKEISSDAAYNDDKTLKENVKEKEVIKGFGTYKVVIKDRKKTYNTKLIIEDKKEPTLTLKEVKIIEGTKIDINSFIVSCTDNSHTECIFEVTNENGFKTDLDTSITDGRDIYITAKDKALNKAVQKTRLVVVSKAVIKERYNKCFSSKLSDNDFSAELKKLKSNILGMYNTNANFKYEDFNDGYTFGKNQNAALYAASVNKLPLVIYAYYLADQGKLNLNEKMTYTSNFRHGGSGVIQYSPIGTVYTLNELLDKTIIYSDNVGYFMLLSKISKSDVKKYWNKLGYNIIYTDNFGNVSPEGMSVYAKEAYKYYLKGSSNAKRLISNMKKSDELDVIKNSGINYELAHKYGYQGIYYNDVSIAFDQHPYSLSIMSTMGDTKAKDNFFLKSHKLINEFNRLYWQEKSQVCKIKSETL